MTKHRLELEPLLVSRGASVRQVLECIDRNKAGVALMVDEAGRLLGTITDGDVRRFILARRDLDEPAEGIVWQRPVVAPVGTDLEELKRLMTLHKVRLIPVVDAERRPVGVFSHRELLFSEGDTRQVVVMAGGEGKRLLPLTAETPKPMLKVGDTPVLENLIRGLVANEFKRIFLAVNYKAEVIEEYFGDGAALGADISYLRERDKLGTAGALALLPKVPTAPLLVINGDVVTGADFNRLHDFHLQHRAVMTVASIEYKVQVPYGALRLAGHFLLGVDEKPQQVFRCNAGIYVLNPELLRLVPKGRTYDMTDLLADALRGGLPVCTFPLREYWLDIGQLNDLERARRECAGGTPAVRE